jgi:Domain of unknown function (DUF4403)
MHTGHRPPLATLCVPAIVALVAACGPPRKVDVRPPTTASDAAEADSLPPAPPTYASAPVSVDLRLILREIERTIPDHIGSLTDRLLISTKPRTWVALEVQRGPLDIDFGPSSMTVTATVAYRGRVWRKVPLATVSASCGTGEKAPLARIRIRTSYRVDSTWRIRTASKVISAERATQDPADECHVTFLSIDVTSKVLEAARLAVNKALRVADARLALVDVRSAVTPVWASLQDPISIRDSTLWLSLHPRAVGVSNVTVRDSFAHATVTLLAQPSIQSGAKPRPDTTPLPYLTRVQGVDTLLSVVDGTLSYSAANEILRQSLRGHKLHVRGRRLIIEDVAMTYIGHHRIALGVLLSGAAEGRVYFIGTPAYDAKTDAIVVPDLSYDIHTTNLLVQSIAWLAGDKLRDELRRTARLPAASTLDLARGLANQQITRTLADGVKLSGEIGAARALQVQATSQGLHARARGTGRLALDIRLESIFANTHIPRHPLKGMDTTQVAEK